MLDVPPLTAAEGSAEGEHPLAESFADDIDAKLSLRACEQLLCPRVLGHILVRTS